jgi:hypothetical protein
MDNSNLKVESQSLYSNQDGPLPSTTTSNDIFNSADHAEQVSSPVSSATLVTEPITPPSPTLKETNLNVGKPALIPSQDTTSRGSNDNEFKEEDDDRYDPLSLPDSQAPPDGGTEAWMVVFASFMVHFIMLGIFYSFGVYQASEPTSFATYTTNLTIFPAIVAECNLCLVFLGCIKPTLSTVLLYTRKGNSISSNYWIDS